MTVKDLTDVCRLCLRKESLLWIFDKKYQEPENIKDIIYITTGVQILSKDEISQKICDKCCKIAKKMFEFRSQSLENDLKLRDLWKEKQRLTNVDVKPNVIIKTEPDIKPKTEIKKKHSSKKIHASVNNIYATYPNIFLPDIALNYNMSPWVSLKLDEVESYFKRSNINMKKHIHFALKSYKENIKKEQENNNLLKNCERLSLPQINTKAEVTVKNTKSEFVAPISIKLNPSSSNYGIVTEDKKFIANSKTTSVISNDKIRKRKSSSDCPVPEKKATLIESLGLTPSIKSKSSDLVDLAVEKQTVICDLCNAVYSHSKDLKKHFLKHLYCQFCKTKFKTLDLKEAHIKQFCIIKNTMNNLPTINLKRIEFDKQARKNYSNAFLDFPAIPDSDSEKDSQNSSSTNDGVIKERVSDVIEILSDDESSSITAKTAYKNTAEKNKTKHIGTAQNTTDSSILPKHSSDSSMGSISSSIVKPDVKIKNCSVLDSINPKTTDLTILKELIKSSLMFKLSSHQTTQTALPEPSSIHTNKQDFTTLLKDLKPYLHIYKISVDIKQSSSFQVSYNYEKPEKPIRKLWVWNDLTPIDVSTPVQMQNVSLAKTNKNTDGSMNNSISNVSSNLNTPIETTVASNSLVSSIILQDSSNGNLEPLKTTAALKRTNSSQSKSPPINVTPSNSITNNNIQSVSSPVTKITSNSMPLLSVIHAPPIPYNTHAQSISHASSVRNTHPTLNNTTLLPTTQAPNVRSPPTVPNNMHVLSTTPIPNVRNSPILPTNIPALPTTHASTVRNPPPPYPSTTTTTTTSLPIRFQAKNSSNPLQNIENSYNPLTNGYRFNHINSTLQTHPPPLVNLPLNTPQSSGGLSSNSPQQRITVANNVSITNQSPTFAAPQTLFPVVPQTYAVSQPVGVTQTVSSINPAITTPSVLNYQNVPTAVITYPSNHATAAQSVVYPSAASVITAPPATVAQSNAYPVDRPLQIKNFSTAAYQNAQSSLIKYPNTTTSAVLQTISYPTSSLSNTVLTTNPFQTSQSTIPTTLHFQTTQTPISTTIPFQTTQSTVLTDPCNTSAVNSLSSIHGYINDSVATQNSRQIMPSLGTIRVKNVWELK